MKHIISIFIFIAVSLFVTAQTTQSGYVKTKGRMDNNGKLIPGTRLSGAAITLTGGHSTVSGTDGTFKLIIPDKKYYLQNVQKKDYVLSDPEILTKQYVYSDNPLVITMETPAQQLKDQVEAQKKIEATLRQQLQQREKELEVLKNSNKITEDEYYQKLQQLYDEKVTENLVKEMSKRYSEIDYDLIDSFQREFSVYILNGELPKADSLLKTKGNLSADVSELQQIRKANIIEREKLERRRQQLDSSISYAQWLMEDIAMRCYNKAEIFKLRYQNDSAAYYLELRAGLDTTNWMWQSDVAYYFHFQNQFQIAESYYNRTLNILSSLILQDTLQAYLPLLVATWDNLADLYHVTRQFTKAEAIYEKDLNIRRSLAEENPSLSLFECDLAKTLNNMAGLFMSTGDFGKSEALLTEALGIRRKLAGDNPQTYLPDLAKTLNLMAILYKTTLRYIEAEAMYKEALEIYRRLAKDNSYVYEHELASSFNNLANLYFATQQYSNAETMHREALGIRRGLAKKNPQAHEPGLAMTLGNIANLHSKTGDYIEAELMHKEALEIYRRLARENPQAYEFDVARSLQNLAGLYREIQRYSESDSLYRESLEIYRRLVIYDPQVYNPDLARVLNGYGMLNVVANRHADAEFLYLESLDIYRRLVEEAPEVYESDYAFVTDNLALLYYDMRKYAKAEPLFKESLEIYMRLAKDNAQMYEPSIAVILSDLGEIYYQRRNYQQSKEYYIAAVEILNKCFENSPDTYRTDLVWGYYRLMYTYARLGDYVKAFESIDQAIALVPDNADIYYSKGSLFLSLGDNANALKMWEKIIELDPDFLSRHGGRTDFSDDLIKRGLITMGQTGQNERSIAVELCKRGEYSTAFPLFLNCAEKGDSIAQTYLGVLYESGRGVTQDYNEAAKWYRKAAEQGVAIAQYNLGLMYKTGKGVNQDNLEALLWFMKAAEQGLDEAQCSVGEICIDNEYFNEAAEWFLKAAKQGHAKSQCYLGILFENGYGVIKDVDIAKDFYRKSAIQGFEPAIEALKRLGDIVNGQ